MNNMVSKWCLFLFLSAVLAAQANYVFIGNSGEGYLENGLLYTRDLYEYDIHANPWVGPLADPLIKKAVIAWNPLNLTEFECDLLARKLSDLNAARPHFGDDIFTALSHYQWSYTENELVLTYPDEVRKPLVQANRVAIANRFLNSIIINRPNFLKLDPVNRVALLLHEVIYSLMHISRQNGLGMQSVSATRQYTASLFRKQYLETSIANPLREINIVRTTFPADFRSILDVPQYRIKMTDNSSRYIALDKVLTLTEIKKNSSGLAKTFCVESIQARPELIIISLMNRSAQPLRYRKPDSSVQYAIAIADSEKIKTYLTASPTLNSCIETLTEALEQPF